MKLVPPPEANATFPIDFKPLAGTPQDCVDCGKAERVGFEFDYAYLFAKPAFRAVATIVPSVYSD